MNSPSLSFSSHLKLAHQYWENYLRPNEWAIDATCGNGHDTLKLCQLALKEKRGQVFAFDIQDKALLNTGQLLKEHLDASQLARTHLINSCHSLLLNHKKQFLQPVKLIVYNFGYLPGGDKSKTTRVHSSLASVQVACELIASGGLISLTCYPGHPEGAIEEKILLDLAANLPRKHWNCCHHRWMNRQRAPSLLLLEKL